MNDGGDNNHRFRRNINGKRLDRVNDVVPFVLQTKEQRAFMWEIKYMME